MDDIDTMIFTGGGIHGVYYIGMYKYLIESGHINHIKTIHGISMGAIISAFMTLRVSIEGMAIIFKNFDCNVLARSLIPEINTKWGLIDLGPFEEYFGTIIQKKTGNAQLTMKEHYEKTGFHLKIYASCINNGEVEYFDYIKTPDMPLLKAVSVSVSLPIIFPPYLYNGKYYVDGGLYKVDYVLDDPKKTILLTHDDNLSDITEIDGPFSYFATLMKNVARNYYKRDWQTQWKTLLYHVDTSIPFFRFEKAQEKFGICMEDGYRQTIEFVERLKAEKESALKQSEMQRPMELLLYCEENTENRENKENAIEIGAKNQLKDIYTDDIEKSNRNKEIVDDAE